MKRTQIQLDDATYAAVRRRAFEQGRSVAENHDGLYAEAVANRWQGADRPEGSHRLDES